MAYSYTQYTVASSNDTTTTYATPPYRSGKAATDISVAVDGVTKTAGVDYTVSGTSVTFTVAGAPLANSVVRIARNTSQNAAPSDYSENTILTSAQLNATQEQLFFMAQEAIDTASETNLAGQTFYSSSSSAPTSPILGDLWYDTFNKYLKIYNGSEWELATPTNESFTYTSFTAEAGTYSYVTVANLNTEALVFLNGVKQVRDTVKANLLASSGAKDYFIDTVNSRVYFKTLGAGSVVEVILAASNLGTANSTKIETFTATANQTVFNLTNTYLQNTNSVNIFVNGVRQSAFTETDNNTVTLTNGASVGDEVVVIINLYDTVQGAVTIDGMVSAAAESSTPSGSTPVTAGKMINPSVSGSSTNHQNAIIASKDSKAAFVRSATLGSIYSLAEGNSSAALVSRLVKARHNNTYALGTEEAYLNERKAGAISCLRHSGTGTYGVGIAAQDCATSANGNNLGRTTVMASTNTVVGEGYHAYFNPVVNSGVLTALSVDGTASAPAGVAFATTNTITKSSGSWYDDGFHHGENIKISGSTSNDGIYFITSISGNTLYLRDAPLTVETFAGTVAPQTGGWGYNSSASIVSEDINALATLGTLTPTINSDGVITSIAVSGTWANVGDHTRFKVNSGSTAFSSGIACAGSNTAGRGKTLIEASTSAAIATSGGHIKPTASRALLAATKDCDVSHSNSIVMACSGSKAEADYSAIIAGNNNIVSGELSLAISGSGNILSGARSVVFGRNVESTDNYFISWGYSDNTITQTGANQNIKGFIDARTGEIATGNVRPLVTQTSSLGETTRRYNEAWADTLIQTPKTVATLPTGVTGSRAFVTDSTVTAAGNFGAVVAGGGTGNVPVFYDGTNWLIG